MIEEYGIAEFMEEDMAKRGLTGLPTGIVLFKLLADVMVAGGEVV